MSEALSAADLQLFARITSGNEWLRSLLCTLARRGGWLRRTDEPRATALLTLVAPWPPYKAGQFLFDLLEWEDFMVDGPPPALLPGALDDVALARAGDFLRRLASFLDGAKAEPQPGEHSQRTAVPPDSAGFPPPAELPPLEPGFYLYQDVVLGVLLSVEAEQSR